MKRFLTYVMIILLPAFLFAQKPQPGAAPDPPAAQSVPVSPNSPDTLENGTPVKLSLSQNLSSATAHVGDEVHFEVLEDVLVSGVVVIRSGTTAIGTITVAQHASSRGRAGKLDLSISYVPLVDKEKASLRGAKEKSGQSNVKLMASMMVITAVCIPCEGILLMMKGAELTIPAGKKIIVFVDGDMHLDMAKFEAEPAASADTAKAEISSAVSRWNDLQFSNDVQALESYVHDFPGGQYTPLAEARIVSARQALEKAKLPPVLFVYNIEISFGGSQFFVDGKPIVKLGSMRYAKIRLQPGLRHFQLVSLKGPVMELNVNMGDEIYLPVRGGMSPHVGILPQASPAVAKELLAKGTLKPAKAADILDPVSNIP